ncbi:MAG: HAD-IB family hydrolase, partial [Luminiphilus sp.]|nr:HAD-IB family hydrolase [Luminiphilus sp.]
LCAEGLVDAQRFSHDNDRFYQDYQEGRLDIYAYLRFALAPLTGRSIEEVARLQQQFMRDWVEPMLLPAAFELLDKHRNRGDELVIITASNTVVTGPIAERLGVATLMGCDTEIVGGKYTGQPTGVPSFQEGKVTRLQDWLATTGHSLTGAWFYSDSHNDLPLLERVDNPVATDPDPQLAAVANDRGWPIISLR